MTNDVKAAAREELALEWHAAEEHARRHRELWDAGRYLAAIEELRAHEAALERIAELNAELEVEEAHPHRWVVVRRERNTDHPLVRRCECGATERHHRGRWVAAGEVKP